MHPVVDDHTAANTVAFSKYPSPYELSGVDERQAVSGPSLGVETSYVDGKLFVKRLAPNIVEAILRGKEPSRLSLEGLVKGMPMEWEEQRQAFGLQRTP